MKIEKFYEGDDTPQGSERPEGPETSKKEEKRFISFDITKTSDFIFLAVSYRDVGMYNIDDEDLMDEFINMFDGKYKMEKKFFDKEKGKEVYENIAVEMMENFFDKEKGKEGNKSITIKIKKKIFGKEKGEEGNESTTDSVHPKPQIRTAVYRLKLENPTKEPTTIYLLKNVSGICRFVEDVGPTENDEDPKHILKRFILLNVDGIFSFEYDMKDNDFDTYERFNYPEVIEKELNELKEFELREWKDLKDLKDLKDFDEFKESEELRGKEKLKEKEENDEKELEKKLESRELKYMKRLLSLIHKKYFLVEDHKNNMLEGK